MLHLAHDGIDAQTAEELARIRRVVTHDHGDYATGIKLLLGGVLSIFGHRTPPVADCKVRAGV
jgi:hypothetical protein